MAFSAGVEATNVSTIDLRVISMAFLSPEMFPVFDVVSYNGKRRETERVRKRGVRGNVVH